MMLVHFILISQLPAPTPSPRSPRLGNGDEFPPKPCIGESHLEEQGLFWYGDRGSTRVVDSTDQREKLGPG